MYFKQIFLGMFAGAILITPVLLQLPGQVSAFITDAFLKAEAEIAQSELTTSEQQQRNRISEKRKTADSLYSAGILPSATKLKIRRYLDNPKRDPKPDTTGWLSDEVVFVYDSAGVCIGRIQDRQWKWKHHVENACDGLPTN